MDSTTACNEESLETGTTLISPTTAQEGPCAYPRPSRLNIFSSRPSPLARLHRNKKAVDPPTPKEGREYPRMIRSAGTFDEPIHLEDMVEDAEGGIVQNSTAPSTASLYKGHNNNKTKGRGVGQPKELEIAIKRDRIMESRDPADYKEDSLDGNDGFRTPSNEELATETHARVNSLEMKSLHSKSVFMDPYHKSDTARRDSPKVHFEKLSIDADTKTLNESSEAINRRYTPVSGGHELLSINETYRREKQLQIYRPQSVPISPPVLDQKTVRFLYSKDFQELIAIQLEQESASQKNDNPNPKGLASHRRVTFVARKRPISNEEVSIGDFDVVNPGTGNSTSSVVVYEAKIMPDLTTKFLTPHRFQCDGVFSEQHASEEFYIRSGQSLVLSAKAGGSSAFVIYGCPGSGTSYTMSDIEERAVFDIFGSNMSEKSPSVSIQYAELIGKQCFDLIGPVGNFVRVVESSDGSFQFKGAVTKTASSANEMLMMLSDAKRRLATQASIRKKTVGHTFIVCRLLIRQERHSGCLTIVECLTAQTEGQDSSESSSIQFDELMECVGTKASGKFGSNISGSSSNITKLLKQTLYDPHSRICVVAGISPCASATDSTLLTLLNLSKLSILSQKASSPKQSFSPKNENEDLTLPRQWSHAELVSWLGKKNLLSNPVPPDVNGRFAMRMSKMQLKNTFYDVVDEAKAEKLYSALRAESDRIARIRVKRRIAKDLEKSSE